MAKTGYTGRYLYRIVTDVLRGSYGLPPKLAVLSIRAPRGNEYSWGDSAIELKTDPGPFTAVWEDRKTCEIRSEEDRIFEVGQVLKLCEYVRGWSLAGDAIVEDE